MHSFQYLLPGATLEIDIEADLNNFILGIYHGCTLYICLVFLLKYQKSMNIVKWKNSHLIIIDNLSKDVS